MITTNYSDHQTPGFRVLSDAQCHELFLAALECLKRVGIQVNNAKARELLAAAGAEVADKNIVRIPPHVVQEALTVAPRTFTVWGRDYQHEMRIALDRVHFGPGPTCTYFIDPTTGQRRRARRGDAGMTARVCDALNHIDYVMGLSLFDDVIPVLSPVYEFAEMIANTSKPVIAWANTPDALHDIYRIALVVAGSEVSLRRKPIFAFFATYESPLRLADAPLANLLWGADHGIPVICLGGPTVGLESPFSGASALVLHLASVLSVLAIVQLTQRGAPVVIGGAPSVMDLRTGRPAFGSPEMSLHSAAAVDVARCLGIPFMGTAGASESKLLDAQAGIEASIQVLLSALSGASLVHDVGFLDCADIGSLSYLVLVDEIIGMVKRIMRGIQVNSETIMLDLIEQVGPGGTFLTQPRSATLCRAEAWVPAVLDRTPYAIWEQKGRRSTEELVAERMHKILDTHQAPPLPPGATEKIEEILNEAEEREQKRSS